MNSFEKYFNDRKESNNPTTDKEIIDLETRLNSKLPDDYKQFLKKINGYEGFLGQSYVRLVSVKELEEFTDIFCSEIYPDKICIGTNGGGEVFMIEKADKQQYGVAPSIGDERDYIGLGDTIDKFLDRLYNGTFLK
jgi:hypothetical protein